ncbi:hypothetical protein LCGC14_3076300 [marine sediment metagenome]|uniref:Uncharacterized protein n=1 Tax=marine sediment metagenome TaxID=412755 RepID=A0A0F8V7I6_9ZZZZ
MILLIFFLFSKQLRDLLHQILFQWFLFSFTMPTITFLWFNFSTTFLCSIFTIMMMPTFTSITSIWVIMTSGISFYFHFKSPKQSQHKPVEELGLLFIAIFFFLQPLQYSVRSTWFFHILLQNTKLPLSPLIFPSSPYCKSLF